VPRTYLPRPYLESFRDGETGGPGVFVYRAAIGEWKRASVAGGDLSGPHFNEIGDAALHKAPDLDLALAAIEADAAGLVAGKIARREPLSAAERRLLASFFGLLGVRLSPRFAQIEEGEARAGCESLTAVLEEMGWVFWLSEPPLYFITSSSPFLVSFPRREEQIGPNIDIHTPSAEVTLPLSSAVALHATWKRRGELWRRAGDDALLEINGRTCQRARAFLVSPRPAVPG
jgi:hypothetical protein